MHGCHGGVEPWWYVLPLCIGAAPPCLVSSFGDRLFWESTGRHHLRGSSSKAAAFVRNRGSNDNVATMKVSMVNFPAFRWHLQMRSGRVSKWHIRAVFNVFKIKKGTDVPICRDQVRIVSCNDLRPQDACDWSMDLALGCRHRKQVRNRAAAILCKYAGHLAAYVLYYGPRVLINFFKKFFQKNFFLI